MQSQRQYLLTLQVSRYCIFYFQSRVYLTELTPEGPYTRVHSSKFTPKFRLQVKFSDDTCNIFNDDLLVIKTAKLTFLNVP